MRTVVPKSPVRGMVFMKSKRKYEIDNLRNITILFLFPVHTFMIWNDFGSSFYIWQGGNRVLSTLIVLINPWFMPFLFVLAGISARYALQKRTNKQFIAERIKKLLVPFVFGLVVLVPFQTLYARKFFSGYDGGLLKNWGYFFTHFTDLSGYDGAFTPGHLWFILFLFLISLIALAVFRLAPYEKFSERIGKAPVLAVLLLFVPIWLMYYVGNFGGYSLGKDFMLYLAGYYVLSNDKIVETLEKNIKWLAGLFVIGTLASVVLYYKFSYYGDLWVTFIGWISILVFLVAGKRFFSRKTRFTEYFNRASYPIYILHQSILVVSAYYLVRASDMLPVQVLSICIGSFLLTVLAYQLIKWIPVVRKGIGVK